MHNLFYIYIYHCYLGHNKCTIYQEFNSTLEKVKQISCVMEWNTLEVMHHWVDTITNTANISKANPITIIYSTISIIVPFMENTLYLYCVKDDYLVASLMF